MNIALPENLTTELHEAAHYCSIPPDRLITLFVEDGLKLYRESCDEFRGTLDGENQ
jgi:hypothetical protein